jgi:outer membrane protein assembly factor BamE (lipoprotein component of BamABCDE complex)
MNMFKQSNTWILLGLLSAFLLSGCQSAAQHKASVQDDSVDRITVGSVQREIHVGMSGTEVARVLGSPNIVSTDEERREIWIYDKIATDSAASSSSVGGTILILGAHSSAAATSTSQRTLTVIIKFDKAGKVRDFSYRTSRF